MQKAWAVKCTSMQPRRTAGHRGRYELLWIHLRCIAVINYSSTEFYWVLLSIMVMDVKRLPCLPARCASAAAAACSKTMAAASAANAVRSGLEAGASPWNEGAVTSAVLRWLVFILHTTSATHTTCIRLGFETEMQLLVAMEELTTLLKSFSMYMWTDLCIYTVQRMQSYLPA